MGCSIIDPVACVGDAASAAVGDAIKNMATAVLEAFGKAVASLGTLWVNIGTPTLTDEGGTDSPIAAGSAPAGSEGIVTILGYVEWISLVVAVASILILGALIGTRIRRGEGFQAVGRIGIVLSGIFLISGASALVAALLPSGPQGAGGAVYFLQSSLWWITGALTVVSVVIGGARTAWEQRADPAKDTLKSIITLIVVAGVGVTAVALLVSAFDSFSIWILNGSLSCDVGADSACFGTNIAALLALTTNPTVSGLGPLLIIILGIIAILATAVQIVLMIARGGMLVILTGILPLSAAATNTEMGRSWFRKNVGWLIAFILYKPAAAIVYAAAFRLAGTNIFQDDGTGFVAVLTGLILMVLALFAMPALMRFVTPLVGALSAGAAGGIGFAALAALPSGAASVGRLATGSGGGSAGGPGFTGSTGSTGSQGPSGANGSGQTSRPMPQTSGAGAGSSGAAASTGARTSAAGGGAAAGGAAAGGSAAAAGSAAGPWGAAAGAALDAGRAVGQAATGAARSAASSATGEGSGS